MQTYHKIIDCGLEFNVTVKIGTIDKHMAHKLVDSSLKFGDHINKIIVHKANRLLGVIKRTFSYLESQMLRLLYTTLIRPHLD